MDGDSCDESASLLQSSSSQVVETEEQYKSRQRSLRILYFTNFLGAVGFSVVMPSVWPFLQVIYPEAKTSFLGLVIASYSLGQFIMSPILGWLANHLNKSMPPLIIGLTFQVAGNIIWAYLQDMPVLNGYCMVIGRTLIGVGAANMAVIRSYVSKATTLDERTGVNAIISACQALGFCLGPGIQAAFYPLHYPGPIELPGLHLNIYTAPGWIGAILGTINIVALFFVFREHEIPDDASSARMVNSRYTANNENESSEDRVKPDYLVVILLLFCFFVILFLFVMFETISTPLSIYEYGWNKENATLYNGIIWTTTGVISIGVVILIRGPLKRVQERLLLVISYILLILGMIVYLPYGGKTPEIRWMNGTNSSTEGGCPSTLDWCFHVPQIHLFQLLGATFFLSLGYPATNLLIYTLFSKILGPIPQGLWMGLFTAAGSLARMVGPIYVGFILQNYGPLVTLASVGGLLASTCVIVLVIYRRLVPYVVRLQREQNVAYG